MDILIKVAKASDLGRIVALNDQVQRQHADAYPDDFLFPTNAEDVSDFFSALLDDESQELLLACVEGDVIAYLWYQIQRRPPNPFTKPISRLFIHHVVVDGKFRRQGVAGHLFERVEREARSRGHAEIALDTWASNTEAQGFFMSQGFQPCRYILRKALRENG